MDIACPCVLWYLPGRKAVIDINAWYLFITLDHTERLFRPIYFDSVDKTDFQSPFILSLIWPLRDCPSLLRNKCDAQIHGL
jgi:hypothetical protein